MVLYLVCFAVCFRLCQLGFCGLLVLGVSFADLFLVCIAVW